MLLAFLSVLLLLGASTASGATEIATGSMLGPRYKTHRFYMRTSSSRDWKETYSEGRYRGKARGKLMGIRLSEALFDGTGLSGKAFDPDRNTGRVIQALDLYAEYGIRAITVSLQGSRDDGSSSATTELGSGALSMGPVQFSAFEPDGALKSGWMARLGRLLQAADRKGMVVCVTYFSHGREEMFDSTGAIVAAARNVTDWLIENNFRNVVIDVADSWNGAASEWGQGNFIPEYISYLVEDVRERFHGADFALPIGASTDGSMTYPASLAQICDVVLVRGDGRSPGQKRSRLRELEANLRPVWMVGDDNGREISEANLLREVSSAAEVFQNGAGWTYRPWRQVRRPPFVYQPAPDTEPAETASALDPEGAYFRSVLEEIAALVMKKPPQKRKNKKKR